METQRLMLVIAAVVQFSLWLVLSGRYRTPPAAAGTVVLRYGPKLRLLGLCIAFAIPALLVVLLVATPIRYTRNLAPLGVTFLALGFVGGSLLLETQGVRLTVTDLGIISMSPWRRRHEWRWDEIEQVSFSRLNYWLILDGPRQEKIRASLFLVGIRDLARAALQHVSGIKLARARKVLDRLAG